MRRWHLQQGRSVIPKSTQAAAVRREHRENFGCPIFEDELKCRQQRPQTPDSG